MDTTLRGDLSELLLGGDKSAAGKTAVRAVAPLRSTTKLLMQAAAVHAAEGAGSESGLQSLVGKLFSRDADAGGATLALDNHVPRARGALDIHRPGPARPPARPPALPCSRATNTRNSPPCASAGGRAPRASRGAARRRVVQVVQVHAFNPAVPPLSSSGTRTNRTRLVPPPVLTGHASSIPRY